MERDRRLRVEGRVMMRPRTQCQALGQRSARFRRKVDPDRLGARARDREETDRMRVRHMLLVAAATWWALVVPALAGEYDLVIEEKAINITG